MAICMGGAMAFGACGGARNDPANGERPARATVPLASASSQAGEIVVKGEASPGEHGPFDLDGRYRVRFEQTAPEDPSIDFADETPFVARLMSPGDHGAGKRLFRAAAARGQRTLTLHGRYLIDVEFGDWPYAIRLTPAG